MIYQDFSPWPTISRDRQLKDGFLLPINPTCRVCEHRACQAYHEGANEAVAIKTCPKGFDCYAFRPRNELGTVVIIGAGDPSRRNLPGLFRRYKEYLLSPEAVRRWTTSVRLVLEQANLILTEDMERAVQGLHNIQPAVNIAVRGAEKIISEGDGRDFDEKLRLAPATHRDLYYAADLITWMIATQQDLVRPESIKHGTRHPMQVYELVDRLVRSFRLVAEANRNRIRISGSCYRPIPCFESLGTLLFVLLHNAVKYSLPQQEILVEIDDLGNCVKIRIDSFGPAILPEERESIFSSGMRGQNARKFTGEGSGKGLYVAKIIAAKHGTFIDYTPPNYSTDYNGIPCGQNRFTIRLYS